MIKTAMSTLTRDEVNQYIKARLANRHFVITVVTKDGEDFKKLLASDDPSPMTYNSPKPEAIMAEDKIVEKYPLGLKAENITVVPVGSIFQ